MGWETIDEQVWQSAGSTFTTITARLRIIGGYLFRVSSVDAFGSVSESLEFVPYLGDFIPLKKKQEQSDGEKPEAADS